jgi:hypothetical protein
MPRGVKRGDIIKGHARSGKRRIMASFEQHEFQELVSAAEKNKMSVSDIIRDLVRSGLLVRRLSGLKDASNGE